MFLYGLVLAWSKCSKPLEFGVTITTVIPTGAEFKNGILQASANGHLPLTLTSTLTLTLSLTLTRTLSQSCIL